MTSKPKHPPTSKSSAERFQPRRVRRWPTPTANFPCSRPEVTCRTPSICTCRGTWPLCRATSVALIPPLSSERSPSVGMSAVARACAHWWAPPNTSRPWWGRELGSPRSGRRCPPSVPPTESELVRLTMAGLSRRNRRPVRLRPLLDDAVEAILATARLPSERDRRGMESPGRAARRGVVDIALVLVLRDCGLRRSEAAVLVWSGIEHWADGSGRLLIERIKTDQTGEGEVVLITRRAMTALDELRQIREDYGDASPPVFGMTAKTINRRVKAAAQAAGLGAGFSGHSGRVGLARRMARAGAPDSAIMRQGRWSSSAMVPSTPGARRRATPPGGWNEGGEGRPAASVPVVMVLQGPGLHQLEEPRGTLACRVVTFPAGRTASRGSRSPRRGADPRGRPTSRSKPCPCRRRISRRARRSRRGGILWRSLRPPELLFQGARKLS